MGLTILTRIIRTAVTSIIDRRETRRLERINYRRNAEKLLVLFEDIRLESDNLIVFVRPTVRLHRLHRSLAVVLRDHVVGRRDAYPEVFLPTIIPDKMLILAS